MTIVNHTNSEHDNDISYCEQLDRIYLELDMKTQTNLLVEGTF